MTPSSHIRVGTLNIRSALSGNLEAALMGIHQLNIDIAILTESKLTTDRYTHQRNGYKIFATTARSTSQGGIAVAFRQQDHRFLTTELKVWGHDTISLVITSGHLQRCLIGVYIPPSGDENIYGKTLAELNKAITWATSKEYHPIVLGDINVNMHQVSNILNNIQHRGPNDQENRRIETLSLLASHGLQDVGLGLGLL